MAPSGIAHRQVPPGNRHAPSPARRRRAVRARPARLRGRRARQGKRPVLRQPVRQPRRQAGGRAYASGARWQDRRSAGRPRRGARQCDRHRPFGPYLHGRLDRPARAPGRRIQPAELFRGLSPGRRGLRLPQRGLCREDPDGRLHQRARPRRHGHPAPARRDQPGPDQGPADLGGGHRHRHHRRPRRPHQWLQHAAVAPAGPARPHRGRGQFDRRCPPGGAPALQGRQRRDQDHRHRRRAQLREIGRRAAVHHRRGQGHRRYRQGLRLPRGRACAWRGRHVPRGRRRGDQHRARHLHERAGDEADEGERHLVRADHHRRPLRRRQGEDRRLLPRRGAAEGRADRRADPGHRRPRLPQRGEDRLRHRHGRGPARPECEGIRVHGRGRHSRGICIAGGDHPRRRGTRRR